MTTLSRAANWCLRPLGLELRRRRGKRSPKRDDSRDQSPNADNPYRLLSNRRIRTILDIGANKGDFVADMLVIFPGATIHCFEPLRTCYGGLVERFSGDSERIHLHNVAVGNQTGHAVMQRNQFTPSSSLLPMIELHKTAFPFTSVVEEEEVQIETLDAIVRDRNIALDQPALVKIDVQGFEGRVIDGGKAVLSTCAFVIIETTYKPLYDGQDLFESIYARLTGLGFTFHGNISQLVNPIDGEILQGDSLFERR